MALIRKLIKTIFFAAFAIAGVGFTRELAALFRSPGAEWLKPPLLWLLVGFGAYFPIHFIFRRLIVLHVFGHELTHALWSMLFGGKVEEIYVSRRKGGYATYTRGNFLVTLAPYFFPLYAIFFMVLHEIVRGSVLPYIDGLLGLSIAFHIMLTIFSIGKGQPDLQRSGVLFSIVFIYMMNCIILGLIVCVTTDRSASDYLKGGAEIFRYVWPSIHEAFNWLVHRIAAPFKTPEY